VQIHLARYRSRLRRFQVLHPRDRVRCDPGHAYPYDEHESTFIPKLHESVWRRAGFDAFEHAAQQPGESDLESIGILRELLSELLDGHSLLANNSKWLSFPTVKVERWHSGNVVLLWDAAHTAHFTIGSATKLAFEDAVALSEAIGTHEAFEPALQAYEAERRPQVESTQRAATASREWFERLPQYLRQADEQFVFNLLTRSSPSVSRTSQTQVVLPR
jgi:anthraniloyl-CoA monooxygenase